MTDSPKNDTRTLALSIMIKGLLAFTVGIFLISPLQQLIMRFADKESLAIWRDVSVYQDMIQKVTYLVVFTTVLCYVYFIYQLISQRKEPHQPFKERFNRIIPLLLFWGLAILIPLVTIIRGPNEYDLNGHPYMYESIFSYMIYSICYFFCGAMIWQSKSQKILVCILLFSSIPISIISLYNEWINDIGIFLGAGVSAVFHNSNHYGYYLAITIIAGALLFVYEKKIWIKVIAAIAAIISMIVLVINDTLGAYLSVAFILILFAVYCFFFTKKNRIMSLVLIGVFLLITFVMSFWYSTIMSSLITLSGDIEKIAADPLEADSAGSSRWKLWKGTIKHLSESPWLGFGVEGLLNTYGVGTPHNEFLQYAEFFGIPVSLLYIIACSTVLIKVFKSYKTMSNTTMICFFVSLGYLASSFFGVAIYYTTPFIYIFLGLTYAEYLKNGKSKPSVQQSA